MSKGSAFPCFADGVVYLLPCERAKVSLSSSVIGACGPYLSVTESSGTALNFPSPRTSVTIQSDMPSVISKPTLKSCFLTFRPVDNPNSSTSSANIHRIVSCALSFISSHLLSVHTGLLLPEAPWLQLPAEQKTKGESSQAKERSVP